MSSTDMRHGPLWLGLLAVLGLLAGCTLCNKHLYVFRENPTKTSPPQTALLITEPAQARAAMPGAALDLQGTAHWAPEQADYPTEAYQLAIDGVDGRKAYQGRCLDTLSTYAMEVRPGNRRVAVRAELIGPRGREKFTEVLSLQLEAGKVYFLWPDWQELQNRRLTVKVEPLPEAYSTAMRNRIIDWRRQTTRTATLD